MDIVRPNCRIQFTPEDFAFISRTLGGGRALEQLLRDDDTLPDVLDDPALVRAIQDHPASLSLSPHLYFYLITRSVLRDFKQVNRTAAEYLAEVLVYFANASHLKLRVAGLPPCDYFYEMLFASQQVDADTAFRIRAYMGNYALFMVGLFPERIEHRAAHKGAPSVRYYSGMGVSSYHLASEDRLATRYDLAEVLAGLAENFEPVCEALHRLTDRHLFLGA